MIIGTIFIEDLLWSLIPAAILAVVLYFMQWRENKKYIKIMKELDDKQKVEK